MASLLQTGILNGFECLGDKCEDTCCKGWGMQVDQATWNKYRKEAPELVDAVTSGEAEHIMRRDPDTDYCVKFDQGWCGIHRDYGTDFLGDACHFFPRVTRGLGETVLQTASISCPEIARRALLGENPFVHAVTEAGRLPYSLKHYLPEAVDQEGALRVHEAFLQAAADGEASAERILSRLHSVAESLQALDMKSWPEAVPFYLKMADGRLPAAEVSAADPFNCFHALAGLVAASRKSPRERLQAVMQSIAAALKVEMDADNRLQLAPDSAAAAQDMQRLWLAKQAHWQPLLKRWIQAQLSMALFPFAGFGQTLPERIAIIAVRFATLKLALMAQLQVHGTLNEEDCVRIAQSLARFLDHLADPTLSVQIYAETGWLRPARLRGLLDDC